MTGETVRSRRWREVACAAALWSCLVLTSCDNGSESKKSLDVSAATAAATALAEAIDAFAARVASEWPEHTNRADANALFGKFIEDPAEQARFQTAADRYADFARSAKQSLKDGLKAASQVYESVAIVGPALAMKNRSPPNDGTTLEQVIADLVTRLGQQSKYRETEGFDDFHFAFRGVLVRTTSIGLYAHKGADGRRLAFERLQEAMPPYLVYAPPDDLVDEDGDLDLPFPLDEQTARKLSDWLTKPGLENWLYLLADDWVEAPYGLQRRVFNSVSAILFAGE